MSKKIQLNSGHIAFAVACFIAGAAIVASFRSCGHQEQPPVSPEPIVIHDTVVIHDAAYIAKHTKNKGVVREENANLPVVVNDSSETDSVSADSIDVQVPISSYEYRDTIETDSSRIELGVCFEGYRAKINGIDVKTEYTLHPEPVVVEKKRGWGHFAGISTGPCATVCVNPITGQLEWGVGWSVQLSIWGCGYHY